MTATDRRSSSKKNGVDDDAEKEDDFITLETSDSLSSLYSVNKTNDELESYEGSSNSKSDALNKMEFEDDLVLSKDDSEDATLDIENSGREDMEYATSHNCPSFNPIRMARSINCGRHQ